MCAVACQGHTGCGRPRQSCIQAAEPRPLPEASLSTKIRGRRREEHVLRPHPPPQPSPGPLCAGVGISLRSAGVRACITGAGGRPPTGPAAGATCAQDQEPARASAHMRLLLALSGLARRPPRGLEGLACRGSQGWVLRELFKAISWAGKRKMLIKCPAEA